MNNTVETIKTALAQIIDPNTGQNLVQSKAVKNITLEGTQVTLDIELGYPAKSQIETIRSLVLQALHNLAGIQTAQIQIDSKIIAHAVQRGIHLKPGIKNVIVIASGKGGVGKSTVAANLALALIAEGARVGMLDADIYGPSQPTILGIHAQPESLDGKTMEPLERYGLQVASIGFMMSPDEPVIWRGPLVTQALQQLFNQTHWHDLDYLIVDMPPGTGDIQLTLSQKIPVTGALIVTTPQDLALLDARKGLKMFEKVGIPILGIVENMSAYVCAQCGHTEAIFGSGGGEKMCADLGTHFLGSVPLAMVIREHIDAGQPTLVADPAGVLADIYKQIARQLAVKVAEQAQDRTSRLPKIVVEPGGR